MTAGGKLMLESAHQAGQTVTGRRRNATALLPQESCVSRSKIRKMAGAGEVLTFNVPVAAEGLQGRSKLEKAMGEWFAGEGQGGKFVLWGPGGTGKTTLGLKFAAGQAEGAGARSSVGLVFALCGGSMAEGYAGLLGESCMAACGRARRGCRATWLTDKMGRQTAGQERRREQHGTRAGTPEGA